MKEFKRQQRGKKGQQPAPKEQEVAPFAGHKDDVAPEGVGKTPIAIVEPKKEEKGPGTSGPSSKEDSLVLDFGPIADAAAPATSAATPPVADAEQVPTTAQSTAPVETPGTQAAQVQPPIAPTPITQSDNPLVQEFEVYMRTQVGKTNDLRELLDGIGQTPFLGDPEHPLEKDLSQKADNSTNPEEFRNVLIPIARMLAAFMLKYSRNKGERLTVPETIPIPKTETTPSDVFRFAEQFRKFKTVIDRTNPNLVTFNGLLIPMGTALKSCAQSERIYSAKALGNMGYDKSSKTPKPGLPTDNEATVNFDAADLSVEQRINLEIMIKDPSTADVPSSEAPTRIVTMSELGKKVDLTKLKETDAGKPDELSSASEKPVTGPKEPSTVVTSINAQGEQNPIPVLTDHKDDKTPIPPNAPGLLSPGEQEPKQEPVAASSTSMSANDKVGVDADLLEDGQKVGAGANTMAGNDPVFALSILANQIVLGVQKPHIGINSNLFTIAAQLAKTTPYVMVLPSTATKEDRSKQMEAQNELAKEYAKLYVAAQQIDTQVDNSLSSVTVVRNARQVIPIGDVQGDFDSLTTQFVNAGVLVADAARPSGFALNPEMPPGTQIVFIGDLMDRKDKGMEVVDLVRDLTTQATALKCTVHLVMGNHEQLFLDFFTRYKGLTQSEVLAILAEPRPPQEPLHEDDPNRGFWKPAGVDQTFNSIVRKYGSWENAATKMVEDGTIAFLQNAKGMVVIDNMAFFHGGPINGDKLEDLNSVYSKIFSEPINLWKTVYANSGKYNDFRQQLLQSGDWSNEYVNDWAGVYQVASWLGEMKYQGNPLNLTHAYVGHHASQYRVIANYGQHVTGLDAGMCYGGNVLLIVDPLHSYSERVIGREPTTNSIATYSTVPTLENKGYDNQKNEYVWAYPTTQSAPRARLEVINNPLAVQADEVLSPKAPVPAAPASKPVVPVVTVPTVSPAQELATEFAANVQAGDYAQVERTVLGIAVMASGDVIEQIRTILVHPSAPVKADPLLMEAVITIVTGKAYEFVQYAVTPSATGQASIADGNKLNELRAVTDAVLNSAPDQEKAAAVKRGIANLLFPDPDVRAAMLVVRAVSATETDSAVANRVHDVFTAAIQKALPWNVVAPALVSYSNMRYSKPGTAKEMMSILVGDNKSAQLAVAQSQMPIEKLEVLAEEAAKQAEANKTQLVAAPATQQAQKTATALETLKSDLDKAGRKYSKRQVVDAFTVSTRLARSLEKESKSADKVVKGIMGAEIKANHKDDKEVLAVALALANLSYVDDKNAYLAHNIIPIDYIEAAASLKQPYFPNNRDLANAIHAAPQVAQVAVQSFTQLAQRIVDRRKSAKGAVWLKRGGAAVAVGSIAALLAMSSQHRTKVVPAPPAPIVEEVEPPAPVVAPKAPQMADCTEVVQIALNDAFKGISRGTYQQAYNDSLGRREKAKALKDTDTLAVKFSYEGILSNGSPTTYKVIVNRKKVDIAAPQITADDCKLVATVGDKIFRTTIAPACDDELAAKVNTAVFGSSMRTGAAQREFLKKGTAAKACVEKGLQPYAFTVTPQGKVTLTSATSTCIRPGTVGKDIPTVIVSAPKSNCSVRINFALKNDPFAD